jgi:hypothetical protein
MQRHFARLAATHSPGDRVWGLSVFGEQSRHVIQLLAFLYPDGLTFYVDQLRICMLRLALKGVMLKRLGNDMLYVRMAVGAKLVEDVSDPRSHREHPG